MAGQIGTITVGAKLAGGTQQAFKAIADGMRLMAKSMQTLAKDTRSLGQSAQSKAYAAMAKEMNNLSSAMDKAVQGYDELIGKGKAAATAQADLSKSTAQLDQELEKEAAAAAKATAGMKKHEAAAEVLRTRYQELLAGTSKQSQAANKWVAELQAGTANMSVAREKVARLNKEFVESAQVQARFATSIDKTDREFKQLLASQDKYGREARKLRAEYKKMGGDANDYVARLREIRNTQKASTQEFEKAWRKADGLRRQYDLLVTSGTKFSVQAKAVVQSLRNMDISADQATKELFELNKEFRKTEAGIAAANKLGLQFEKLRNKFAGLTRQQTAYGAGARKLIQNFLSQKITVEQLSRGLTNLEKRQKLVAKAQRDAEASAKRASFQSRKLAVTYDQLINSSTRYGVAARKIIQNLKEQKIAADRAELGLKRLNQQMLGSATPLTQAFNRLGRSFRTYMSYVAASTTIFAFINAAREATRTIIEYDQALMDLKAITRATDEQVGLLDQKMRQVASDTKFSATEIADGMKLLGQSGLTASESIDTIDAVANLATGTLTDLATTVDLVTTAMRVFGIEAENTGRIADVFANAVNRSKLTIDKIRTAMNYIGPVAAAAGASLEETAAAMMILANHGIRASTIGTGLRQVFRRLVQPATKMEAALHAANLTMADFNIETHGLAGVIDSLRAVLTNTQLAFDLFGQRGATAALALAEDGGTAILEMMDIVERTGAAATMAAIQMEGLGVSFKNLQDKIKNLYLALGDSGALGLLQSFVDIARVVTDFLTGVFSSSIAGAVAHIGGLAAGVYALGRAFKWLLAIVFGKNFFKPLILGAQAFTTAAGAATLATRILTGALTALRAVSPLGWITLAVTALSYLIPKFVKTREAVENARRELRVFRAEQQSHIEVIGESITALQAENITQQEKQKIIDKLIQMYPNLAAAVAQNKTATEDLIPILQEELRLRQALKDQASREEITAAGQGLSNTLSRLEEIKQKLATDDFGILSSMGILPNRADLEKEFVELQNLSREQIKKIVEVFNSDLKDLMSGRVADAVKFEMVGASEEAIKVITDLLLLAEQEAEKRAQAAASKAGKTVDALKAEWDILSPADIKADYKEELALLEKNLELENLAIEKAVANRVMTEQEGQDKIQEIEIAASEERIRLAQEAYDKLSYKRAFEDMPAAYLKVQQETEEHYKKLGGYLKKHNEEYQKQLDKQAEKERTHNQKVNDHRAKLEKFDEDRDTKRAEHKKAMADKIEDLERDLAQKISDINQKLNDKLKDLTQKRVEVEKKAQADILGIRQSFEEKMLQLEQRGMSDSEIELSNESFAREQYAAAQNALSAAIRGGDIAGIEQAVELFEKAGEYFGDLADTSKARSGIMSVRDALIAARQEEEKIQKAKIAQEEKDARAGARTEKDKAKREMQDQLTDFTQAQDKKLAKALDTIQQQEQAEDRRWQKELENYDAAIAKIEEKKQAALSAQAEINQYMQQSEFGKEVDKAGKDLGLPGKSAEGTIQPIDENKTEQVIKKAAKKALGSTEVQQAFGNALDMGEVSEQIGANVGVGIAKGMSQFDAVEVAGQPLEGWPEFAKEQGKEAGEIAGDEMVQELNNAIVEYNDAGEPISISFEPSKSSVGEMMDDLQNIVEDSPFEISIDEREARRAIETFVRDAQNRYKITIPVTVSQQRAEGGPVYHMAGGGRLPGQSSPYDSINVKARPGEWFIRNEAVAEWQRRIGDWFMPGVNRPNSTPGKYLQSLLVHGTQQQSVPEIPEMGTITIRSGNEQAQVMATPDNGRQLFKMLEDMEAFST